MSFLRLWDLSFVNDIQYIDTYTYASTPLVRNILLPTGDSRNIYILILMDSDVDYLFICSCENIIY